MISYTPNEPPPFISMSLVSEQPQLVEGTQKCLMLSLAERLWRHLDPSVIVATIKHIVALLYMKKSPKPRDLDMRSESHLPCGFFPQAWFDLPAMILCGKMLEITQTKATVDLAMRNECLQMVSISGFLSPRLRPLFKRITGSQVQHALTA